jgi:hypothetical protein
MKSKTMLQMDTLEMAALTTIESMVRFVALIELHSIETLNAMDDYLESLKDDAETTEEFDLFLAAQSLIRSHTDNQTGE